MNSCDAEVILGNSEVKMTHFSEYNTDGKLQKSGIQLEAIKQEHKQGESSVLFFDRDKQTVEDVDYVLLSFRNREAALKLLGSIHRLLNSDQFFQKEK